MKEAGVPSEFFYYDSAGHAFMNLNVENGTEKLNVMDFPVPEESDVSLAWERLFAFFK